MRLVLLHIKKELKEVSRQPAYLVATILLPCLFFLFFAKPNASTPEASNLLLGSFACFTFYGVIFFQFGVELSTEINSSWSRFSKTLPIKSWKSIFARITSSLIIACIASLFLCITVYQSTQANLSLIELIKLFAYLSLGSIPIGFIALVLAFNFKPKSALPISNIIYLCLAYTGGMWIPPNELPEFVQSFSTYLPTRSFVEFAWGASLNQEIETKFILSAIIYSLIFAGLAHFSQKRFYQNMRL